MPSGYRASRRGSKALKQAKKAEKKYQIATAVHKTSKTAKNTFIVMVQTIATIAGILLAMFVLALAINGVVRWNAKRHADGPGSASQSERFARENVIVIGAEGNDAVGFIAMRVDRKAKQVFGIAIDEGTFIDVPGQGFSRIGDAYSAGPESMATAISNYLTVPFKSYVVVPPAVYRNALKEQDVTAIPDATTDTNLSAGDVGALKAELNEIPQKDVALVPLPVKPIKLGDQTYLEPQRDDVADLLQLWWGIDPSDEQRITRVVVYNGAGKPGIAGEAAQELIRAGIRVVDTQNADNFNYATTKIIVRRGDPAQGDEVRKVLRVGQVTVEPSEQDVTDVVVIIGKDYVPQTVNKKGN
jgi:hypothetical protein